MLTGVPSAVRSLGVIVKPDASPRMTIANLSVGSIEAPSTGKCATISCGGGVQASDDLGHKSAMEKRGQRMNGAFKIERYTDGDLRPDQQSEPKNYDSRVALWSERKNDGYRPLVS